jgi:hypothetical protein
LSPPSELCFKCPPGSRRCPHSNPAPRLNLLSGAATGVRCEV